MIAAAWLVQADEIPDAPCSYSYFCHLSRYYLDPPAVGRDLRPHRGRQQRIRCSTAPLNRPIAWPVARCTLLRGWSTITDWRYLPHACAREAIPGARGTDKLTHIDRERDDQPVTRPKHGRPGAPSYPRPVEQHPEESAEISSKRCATCAARRKTVRRLGLPLSPCPRYRAVPAATKYNSSRGCGTCGAVGGPCGEPHLKIAVNKHRSGVRGKARAATGDRRRRAAHNSSLLSGAQLVPDLNGNASRRSCLI